MAKRAKKIIKLKCFQCKRINYFFKKPKKEGSQKKLELKKYCKWCKKHFLHKETK